MSSLVLEIEIPEGEPEPGDDWRVTQAKTLIRHDSVRKAVLAAVREKIGDTPFKLNVKRRGVRPGVKRGPRSVGDNVMESTGSASATLGASATSREDHQQEQPRPSDASDDNAHAGDLARAAE